MLCQTIEQIQAILITQHTRLQSEFFPKQEKDSPGPYGADRRLYKVLAEGGTPEKLNIMGMMPDFSPDGKKIAFSRLSEFGHEFWLVENFLPTEKKEK